MKFRVSSTLHYSVNDLSTFIFNISASKTPSQTILEESLHIEPFILAEELFSTDGLNRSLRLESHSTGTLQISYRAFVNLEILLVDKDQLNQVPISKLPANVIPFLFQSRYCQSDKLLRLAQDKFREIENGYDKVLEICSWIKKNVEYVSGSTDSGTSAFDTVTERVGVCRDFAHLGIALCRALTIPARYISCYAYKLDPPDFHACFEAYLGGRWVVFDPTQLAPLNGLIRVGTGRDAADTSVATTFGNVSFMSMEVSNQVQDEAFQPWYLMELKERGVCLI